MLNHVARSSRALLSPGVRSLSSVNGPKPLAHKHGDLAPAKTVQPAWASLSPAKICGATPATIYNMCNGKWTSAKATLDIPDPMNGETIIKMPNTAVDELQPFIDAAASCPKTGLHNPFKNKERCVSNCSPDSII